LLPFILIGGAIAQAMFPAYSQLQAQPAQLHALIRKIVRMTAAVSLPLAGMFLFAAGDLLVALLGPKWMQAGPPFRVFAVVFTAVMFTASFPRVYDALNRPVVNLYIALAALPGLVAGIAIGLRWGVLGVAFGISAMALELTCLQVLAVSRTTGLSARAVMSEVWPPAVCVGLGIAAGALPFVLLRADLPNLARDAVASLVMFGIYMLGLRRFFPSRWSEALSQGRAVLAGSRSHLATRSAWRLKRQSGPSE
jgi:O-antigen/teichoic acid export membrane protein